MQHIPLPKLGFSKPHPLVITNTPINLAIFHGRYPLRTNPRGVQCLKVGFGTGTLSIREVDLKAKPVDSLKNHESWHENACILEVQLGLQIDITMITMVTNLHKLGYNPSNYGYISTYNKNCNSK